MLCIGYTDEFTVTFFSMVTTVVLFQGLKASASQILTIVMAFLVICCGITILQMSKIDPTELGKKLDRRTTILLQAARSNTAKFDEKDVSGIEDPGIDSIRGSFGPLGSMIRARSARRLSQASTIQSRHGLPIPRTPGSGSESRYDGLQRHQLYDAPVPSFSIDAVSDNSSIFASPGLTPQPPRTPTIKFGSEDVVHKYPTRGLGAELATHEIRDAAHRSSSIGQTSFNTVSTLEPISEGSVVGLPLQQPRPQVASTPLSNLPDLDRSSTPRTAPAAVYGNYTHPPRRDPFDYSPATAAGTSFAVGGAVAGVRSAVTQPLPQRSRFEEEDDVQAAWERSKEHRGHKNAVSSSEQRGRGYPRGARDDDREESLSLVHNPSLEEFNTDTDDPEDEARRGGIRLVEQSSSTMF